MKNATIRMGILATAVSVATMAVGGTTLAQAGSPPDLTGVELSAWYGANVQGPQRQLLDDFAAATGATINVTVIPDPLEVNLLAKWAGGDRPDIMFWHAQPVRMGELDAANSLQDLSDLPFVARIPESFRSATEANGTRGAILRTPSISGILYNKPVFERLGLTPPSTAAEILALCGQIRSADPSITPVFVGVAPQWTAQFIPLVELGSLWKSDPDFFPNLNSNQGKWNDPKVAENMSLLVDLPANDCLNEDFLTADDGQQLQAVLDGTAAMIFMGAHEAYRLAEGSDRETVDANVGWAPMSHSGPVASFGFGSSEAILAPLTGDATREAAAKAFIEWATSDEVYAKFLEDGGYYPALTGVAVPSTVPPQLLVANEAAGTNGTADLYGEIACSVGPWHVTVGEVLAGTKTIQQLVDSMQTEWERSCKENGQPGF